MLTNNASKLDKAAVSDFHPALDAGDAHRTDFPTELAPRDWKSKYGIDCVDMVHFHHWYVEEIYIDWTAVREPGGEYVKNITIKNVVMKTQKIRYKLPQTRYFSMEFPETQTLSAGMKWTIPVTFRPVAKERYDDVIEFSSSFGVFLLPIKATLPEHVMEFPEIIDFGYCPIKETAKFNFKLQNTGELNSYFEWSIMPPFVISPESGELESGKSCPILIEFKPKEASVIDAVALCSFGIKEQWDKSKVVKSAKIHGIAKYSHLVVVGDTQFDFGSVYIGTSSEKIILLRNPSAVHANFKIKRAEKDNDPCFDFSTTAGRVEKDSSYEIKIKYTPVATGLHSNAYFDITTLSGNTIRIVASACGIGPKVSLEPNLLNFNDILAGNSVIRTFTLRNDSNISTNYQFLIEKNSTFKIDRLYGAIGPNSVVSLQVKMAPTEPINYYRRVYCLVENQDTIHVDFLGTCYNEKRRPATFDPNHIFNYQKRVQNGLVEYGPEQLEELMKNGILKRSNEGILEYVDPVTAKENALKMEKDEPNTNGVVTSEFFYSNSGALACSLLDTYVDFGSCSRYRVIEPRTIRVANNTKGKMTCVWMEEEDANGEALFSVSPKIADISSKSVVEFKVQFRPKVDSEFYGKQLECFCYFKSMRNFRLVNEDTFTPPWCLTPEVAGNTFPSGEDTFIPKTNFGRTTVVFPPCNVDHSEYQILRIANAGDTTIKFSFLDNHSGGIGGDTDLSSKGGPAFSVKPRVGVLKKNESRLIALRFSPSEKRLFEEAFTCFFNNSAHTKYDLHLRGFGAYPEITFESDNRLYFKPTCVGSLASRKFSIRNKSKTSLLFEWKIPKQHANVIAINPISGFLQADQLMQLQCTFVPPSSSKYSLNIPCFFYHDEKNPVKQRATLSIAGVGVFGKLSSSPESLDFSNILINTCVEKEITLFNPSDCDVTFTMGIKKISKDSQGNTRYEELKNSLQDSQIEVLQKRKVLSARSNMSIKVRVSLKDEHFHEFLIFYSTDKFQIAYEQGITLPQDVQQENVHFPLTSIKAQGVHPLLTVPDIRSDGMSKTILWQLFSLERFNRLLSEPTKDPLAYAEQGLEDDSFPTDTIIDCSPLDADINFDFGATSVGSDPMLLKLSLKNSGVVPVDWSFNFPNDTEVEVERWADPGDITEELITRNFILDNHIFEVSPKGGKLEPGQTVTVLLSYSHEFAGPHRLPVLFKLRNGASRSGKEILINFIGYSVPASQKFLHLQSINHEFTPIHVGTQSAPIQYYRMMNRGSADLQYSIDTSSIDQLTRDNMNFPILKCLKTHGSISPGGMDFLHFIFCPLEEKEYELDLPITVNGGKTRIITLRGRGLGLEKPFESTELLDPRHLNQLMPLPTLPPLTNPVARISLERIDFGHLPVCSLMRQVLVVTNNTKEDIITVTWNIPEVWPNESISVVPSTKKLLPGESQVFKVVFEPDQSPRLYNFDIECHVTNDSEVERYRLENRILGQPELLEGHDEKRLSRSSLNIEAGSSTPALNKYKKLPAISTPQPIDGNQGQPSPSPSIYFVGVTAQSHIVEEFRDVYGSYETFYRKKRCGFSSNSNHTSNQDISTIKPLLESTIFSLLNEVFHDKTIQILPEVIAKEPIPFYREQEDAFGDTSSPDETGFNTSDILRSPDFLNAVEAALEGTLYNLMQEIDKKEFEPTTYPLLLSSKDFAAIKAKK